jgi:hypothetical protein
MEAVDDLTTAKASKPRDYVESFLTGAAVGGTGQVATDVIRNVSTNIPISETVYPFVEKILAGASAGTARTGVQKAFNPEEVDMNDLGLNMATMAVWYTIPMLSKKNRQQVNQARNYIAQQKENVDKQAIEALRQLGLDKIATPKQVKQAWNT